MLLISSCTYTFFVFFFFFGGLSSVSTYLPTNQTNNRAGSEFGEEHRGRVQQSGVRLNDDD